MDEDYNEDYNEDEGEISEESADNSNDTSQGLAENIQEDKQIAKDGASLAKNVGTGNVAGAVKDGVNLLKNKKVRKKIILYIVAALASVIILASLVYAIIGAVAEFFASIGDFFNNLGGTEATAGTSYKTYELEDDGAIKIPNENIEAILKHFEDMDVDLDSLYLFGEGNVEQGTSEGNENSVEISGKYIKEFLEAQAVTETVNYNLGENSSKTYGRVYIKRATSDGTIKTLTYTSPESIQEMIDKKDTTTISNYFTLTEDGKVGIPIWTTGDTTTISLKYIDYKNVISQYTTPISFFIDLTIVTQNPNFVSAVADLTKNSRIEITMMENYRTSTTSTIENYVENIKTYKISTKDLNAKLETELEEIAHSEITNSSTSTSITISPVITYVKTWFAEQTIEYEKEEKPVSASNSNSQPDEIEPTVFELEWKEVDKDTNTATAIWLTDKKTITSYEGQNITYKESTRGDVKDKTGEIGSQGLNLSGQVDENSTFVGLLGEKYKIPKTIAKFQAPAQNLIDNAQILFELMKNDSSLQNLEKVMRYILYKYTGDNYGVTELDFSIFNANEFVQYSAVGNLSRYLRQFSHSDEAPKSEDGNYYKMYGDGVGWPTIGNADLQWESNHMKFAFPGKVLENGVEKEVDNVEEYVNAKLFRGPEATYTDEEIDDLEIYIDIKTVDKVGDEQQQWFYDVVLDHTSGLNLSRQQLYALTAICANVPSYINGADSDYIVNNTSFRETYDKASTLYEVNSWQHNLYVWTNWWSYIGGGEPGHIKARDSAFETYVKGTFDFSKSDAKGVFNRQYYMFYTKEELARFSYAEQLPITRTPQNEEELFTLEQSIGTFEENRSEDGKVIGYYTSTTGNVFTVLDQREIEDWDDKCNRAAVGIIISGYSDQTYQEIINAINNDKAKCQRKENPEEAAWENIPYNSFFNQYGLKVEIPPANQYVNDYTNILREQLQVGGYAMIWVDPPGDPDNKDDPSRLYYGESGTLWTDNMHWVAILDYKIEDGSEKILIADYRGADWYSIYEFKDGIDDMALISEK